MMPDNTPPTAHAKGLLAELSELQWDDDQQVEVMRDAFIGEMVRAMARFRPAKLRQVRRFIEIERRAVGCTTPAEELIDNLVFNYESGITPEDLEHQLDLSNSDGFRFSFRDALRDARYFQKAYPRLMAGGAA